MIFWQALGYVTTVGLSAGALAANEERFLDGRYRLIQIAKDTVPSEATVTFPPVRDAYGNVWFQGIRPPDLTRPEMFRIEPTGTLVQMSNVSNGGITSDAGVSHPRLSGDRGTVTWTEQLDTTFDFDDATTRVIVWNGQRQVVAIDGFRAIESVVSNDGSVAWYGSQRIVGGGSSSILRAIFSPGALPSTLLFRLYDESVTVAYSFSWSQDNALFHAAYGWPQPRIVDVLFNGTISYALASAFDLPFSTSGPRDHVVDASESGFVSFCATGSRPALRQVDPSGDESVVHEGPEQLAGISQNERGDVLFGARRDLDDRRFIGVAFRGKPIRTIVRDGLLSWTDGPGGSAGGVVYAADALEDDGSFVFRHGTNSSNFRIGLAIPAEHGDADLDGDVELDDLTLYLEQMAGGQNSASCQRADRDGDRVITFLDLLIALRSFDEFN